ncbi:MAG TPA: ankyrin repeat domain-containing protein, partial [Vicinamibacterales bacterium]
MIFVVCFTGVGAAQGRSDVANAVMTGNTVAVRALIQKKADVNAPQVDGATALHWAVHRDDLATADLLIRAGAGIDVANRHGTTPLAMASLYGNTAMVKRLLEAGADAKRPGPNGETAVMLAARNGNPDIIALLAAAGADVNAKEKIRGTTALMWAAEQKHPLAVKALLDRGADVAARSGPAGLPRNYMANYVNTSAVEAAAQRRLAAAAAGRTYQEQLALERKQGTVPPGPVPALGAAAAAAAPAAAPAPAAAQPADDDDDIIVAGLVGSGGGGLTALVFASREGDLASAKLLLDAGADINQTTEYGWTPLLTAVNNRNYAVAAHLIERGANVNLANKGGWTPLYLATDNRNIEGGDYPVPKPDLDHLEIITRLLERGANPNIRVKDNTLTRTIFTMQWFFEAGATPLIRAAQSGDTELLRLLLKHGADPKLVTDLGDSALTVAGGIGWVEGVTYERSPQDNLETIRLLLDLGLDPNYANNEGRTPLMGAALKGRNDVVRLLVERGARLDTRDRGSRDTDKIGSQAAGHRWQAIDYAEGLVRVGVQSAIPHPGTAALLRQLMIDRGL